MRSDDSEEHKADYLKALQAERGMRANLGESTDDVDAEIARVTGEPKRGGKATRLKGEGRTG